MCVCSSHLNIDNGDGGLGLVEVPSHPVHSLGDKVQHQIQINLIFLEKRREGKKVARSGEENLYNKRFSSSHVIKRRKKICGNCHGDSIRPLPEPGIK